MEARTERAWISVLEKEAKSHAGQLGSGLGNPTALAEAEALSGLRQAGKGVEEKGTQIMSPQTVLPSNSNSVDRRKMRSSLLSVHNVHKQEEAGTEKSAALWWDTTVSNQRRPAPLLQAGYLHSGGTPRM